MKCFQFRQTETIGETEVVPRSCYSTFKKEKCLLEIKLICKHSEPDFATENQLCGSDKTCPTNTISAAVQELHMRVRLCNSHNILFSSTNKSCPQTIRSDGKWDRTFAIQSLSPLPDRIRRRHSLCRHARTIGTCDSGCVTPRALLGGGV